MRTPRAAHKNIANPPKTVKTLFSHAAVRAFILLCIALVLFAPIQAMADPLTPDEVKAISQYPNWVAGDCSSGTDPNSVAAGAGASDGAEFPNLDPTAMAAGIDTFIKKENPQSELNGLGATIVSSAQHSNVSPFLIVAIAHEESSLSDPSDYNVSNGNNSFGRMASSSQPSFPGAGPNAGTSWYKWNSVKASVDNTAPENQPIKGGGDMASYLRSEYGSSIDGSDLTALFLKYAPPSNNDTAAYIANVKGWVNNMAQDTQAAGGGAAGGVASGDIQSLAQQVLSDKNITYDYGPGGPTGSQFRRLANGQKATTDDGREVNVQPILLIALLHLAQSHKVQVSALSDGSSHTAPNNPHGMGDAMDIDFLDGAGTNGSDSVAYKMIDDLEMTLPSGSNFGMGDHPFGTKKVGGKTFNSFHDNPSHVHFDVVGVSQAEIDKAAGGAATVGGVAQNAEACCPGGDQGVAAGGAALTGGSNAEKAFNYFVQQGLSPQASAGLVGNFMQESTAALDTHSDNGSHIGIAQWDTSSRWPGLLSHEKGKDPYDIATQLDYVWYELNGSYKSSVLAPLKSATSSDEAAKTVFDSYEVAGDDTLPARQANAKTVLNKFGGGVAGSVIGGGGGCAAAGNAGAAGANGWDLKGPNAMVYYGQCDSKWGNHPYGNAGQTSICSSGCGITSLAMIVATLTGKPETPLTLSNQYGAQYHTGDGTSWSLWPVAARDYNLHEEDIGTDLSKAAATVKAGGLVIISVNAGQFTSAGHLMVIRATNDSGDFLLADPNNEGNKSLGRGDTNNTPYSADFLRTNGSLYHLWSFTK